MDHSMGALGATPPQTRAVSKSTPQIHAIASYIARGIEHGCGDCIGVELEHFIVRKTDKKLVPYHCNAITGAPGVGTILERLAPFYRERIYETHPDGSQDLIGLSRAYANITLEPGAQVEISISPVLEVRDIEIVYRAFRAELDPILDEFDYELLTLGYHPTSRAADIPLIPKCRYHFMDEHFKETGALGICMMRATASTQVSIDYSSEEDAVRKFRIANLLGPLLAFITDNSPIFEATPVSAASTRDTQKRISASGLRVPERMARTVVWDDVDAARSMTAPNTFDEDFGFASYAAATLQAPAIFTMEKDEAGNSRGVHQRKRAFAEAFEGRGLSREDIEHILSLFFFDVRFKTYVEIRIADSLPLPYALAFAALIKGIFYSEKALAALDILVSRLGRNADTAIAQAKVALRQQGYHALVYGRPATEWLDELVEMARASLGENDRYYLVPLAELIASRTTLADAALAVAHAHAASEDTLGLNTSDMILSDIAFGGEFILEATSTLAEVLVDIVASVVVEA